MRIKVFGRVLVAGAAAFVVVAVAISHVNAGHAAKTNGQQYGDPVMAQLKAGKGRPLGAEPQWVSRWWNCKYHVVQIVNTPTEVVVPQGKTVVNVHDATTPARIMAQLPPRDPKCTDVAPTQAQVDAMIKEVDARNAANRAAAGLPPIPLPTPQLEAVR